jgi:hypothetical protein
MTAGRVGETSVSLSNGEDTKKISVIVEPKYNLFPEPIDKIAFGVSKQKVKEIFGTPDYENSTGIMYNNYHKTYDYMFLFDGDKLESMSVVIATMQLPDNLIDFMVERYVMVEAQGYSSAYLNEKGDMAVGLAPSENLSNMLIVYFPYSNKKSTTALNLKEKMLRTYSSLNK